MCLDLIVVCRGLSGDWGGHVSTAEGLTGLGQAEEAGDQVLFGGIPTRPSSASTAGRSTFDVSIQTFSQALACINRSHLQATVSRLCSISPALFFKPASTVSQQQHLICSHIRTVMKLYQILSVSKWQSTG